MNTAFYVGQLSHARLTPKPHRFSYQVFMPFVDVDAVETLTDNIPLWSRKRLAPARFVRSDFIGPQDMPISDAVKARILEATGSVFSGRVFLLANWRYFGLQNNPIACYFCFEARSERLDYIVAEVTNTPWGERHSYVLPVTDSAQPFQTEFTKELHVSPFHGMDQRYRWFSTTPSESLSIKLTNIEEDKRVFHAVLQLRRVPISARAGLSLLAKFPLETAKVTLGIYWQALVLLLRRVPLYSHPKNNSAH
jgi:DUF1365 family protein